MLNQLAKTLALLPMTMVLPASGLERIDIFTVEGLNMPLGPLVQASGITPEVHKVDELKAIEGALSAGLPRDQEKAAQVALGRLQGESFIAQSEAAKRGMDAVILADQFKLEAVPAVVFDRHYIVYGEEPLAAYHIYLKHREGKQ